MNIELAVEILSKPSPCDGCTGRKKCGELGLACNVFAIYVETGRIAHSIPRQPTAQLFDDVMDDNLPKTKAEWRKEMRKALS